MKSCRSFLAAALIACALCQPAIADELTPEKKADIVHLLDMTGALQLGRQFSRSLTAQIMQIIKGTHPEISQKALDIIPDAIDTVTRRHLHELKQRLVLLYAKEYSDREIKQLIAFYMTPVGRKTIRAMPTLIHDSMLAGQQWAHALGPELEQTLRAKLKTQGVML